MLFTTTKHGLGVCQQRQSRQVERFERQSVAPDECQRVKFVIGSLEEELTRKNPNLRVDLQIVASSKSVHQATYWPSTGFGLTSNYERQANGHLEDNATVSFNNDFNGSNYLDLFNLHIQDRLYFKTTVHKTISRTKLIRLCKSWI